MCAIVQSVHDAHHVEEGESRGSSGGVNTRNCSNKTRDRQTQSITSLDSGNDTGSYGSPANGNRMNVHASFGG